MFYYRVSCVSKDGVEGELSDLPALKAWTTLPIIADWPPNPEINPALGFRTDGSPMTEDINHDGKKEIFVNIGWNEGQGSMGGLLGLTAEGKEIPGYDKQSSSYTEAFYPYQHTASRSTPAIVDLDNNGSKELIVTTYMGGAGTDAKKTMVFSTTQIDEGNIPHLNWEYQTYQDFRGAVVASLDGDENYETAVKGDGTSDFFVFDKNGDPYFPPGSLNPWPVSNENDHLIGNGTPLLADIDLDGNKEFLIGMMRENENSTAESGIYAWKSNGDPYNPKNITPPTPVLFQPSSPLWPVYRMDAPLAVANIMETDDYPEIVCVAADQCHDQPPNEWCHDSWITGHVFILNRDGSCIEGWGYDDHIIHLTNNQSNGANGLPSPSVADINGDSHLEIVIAGYGEIYAWKNTGEPLEYFPIIQANIDPKIIIDPQFITPLLADVDGDGQTDIVVASSSKEANCGGVFAYSNTGSPIVGFPLLIGRVFATPCIDDIDGDGKSELIASSGPKIYAWDCNGRADKILWGKTRFNTDNNAVYDNPCDIASDPIIIENTTVTWTADRFVGGTITIKQGGFLTIKCRVRFSSVAQIIIEPGGKLVVDHGTLTSTCPDEWQGIMVLGERGAEQIPYTNQGYLIVCNNSVIEHANPGIQSEDGGIVIATDAVFKNNRRSVIIVNYPDFENISALTRCSFIFDDKDRLDGNEFCVGAQNIKPLAVYGCTFENRIPFNEIPANYRGKGIVLADADLIVNKTLEQIQGQNPNEIPTTFRGLYYGAHTLGSLEKNTSSILYARFEDNIRGLYQSGYNGISYLVAGKNTFKVPDPELTPEIKGYGMYLNNCSGYTVEENEFFSECATPSGTGLIINESGPDDNQIYNNSFHNLDEGAKPQGQNRFDATNGLCFRCNDFYGNNNDIVILSENPDAPNQGIAVSQGSWDRAAKNTFTMQNNGSAVFFDIYNPFTEIIEYFYDNIPGQGSFVYPDPKSGVERYAVNTSYNKVSDCPSNFTSSNIDELKSDFSISEENADSLIQILVEIVDGGSTESLAGAVNSSTLPEALETRDQLLTVSPYLSDSVMKVAIAKEEVLSNAMIRDVLVENPQSAKSVEVLNSLDQRFIPMPDSMMAEIMSGINILGPKELKEIELLDWNQQHAGAMKSLIRLYTEDTTGMNGTDSVKMLLMQDGCLKSYYDLVSLYFSEGQFETGLQTLDSIPLFFNLTEPQALQHEKYQQLYEIMYQVDTSQLMNASLDSLQVAALTALAAGDDQQPGAYARDLLVAGELISYQEPILEPDYLKASKKWNNEDPSLVRSRDYLFRVWPNPAGSYFTVEYRLLKGYKSVLNTNIVITDILGKEVRTYPVNRYYDQVVVPTEGLSAGCYIISLKVGGTVRKTTNITIVN